MRLKRDSTFLLLSCVALSCSSCHGLFTQQCFAYRIQTPGSAKRQAQLAHLSSSGSCRVPPRQAALRASLRALGAIRFARTGRQRASAEPQCRAATPPSLVPRRRTRSQLPSCSAVAVIAPPSPNSNSSRGSGRRSTRAGATALLEFSEPGVRLAGRPRCRATQQQEPPTCCGQAVAAAGHLARCQAPAGAHRRQRARVAHTTGLSVSSR